MTKQIFFLTALCLVFSSTTGAVLADDWWKKYDHDRDNRWNYDEFSKAQREWQIKHHERVMSEEEMRREWEARAHDGYWQREDARKYHHW